MAGGQACLRELEANAEELDCELDCDAGRDDWSLSLLEPVDEEQCRHIRRQYRQLMDSVQQRRDSIVGAPGDSLSEALEEANALFDGVSRPREAALDAQFLVMASDLGCERARQLNRDLRLFDVVAFSELLLAFAGLSWLEVAQEQSQDGEGLGPAFWSAVRREAAAWLAQTETFHFLLSSLWLGPEAQTPERPRRARRAHVGPAEPTKLVRLDPSAPQESTEREVERVLGLLQTYFRKYPDTPMSYFEFVVDPHSFARTVENMFHVSFIIRDGFARMRLDQDRLPVLEPVDAGPAEDYDLGGWGRKQGVITLSLQDWENIVATFEISQAMITSSC
ncbi:EP300-interacting inhibitor of differentiation 3 [Octodon degus]|uniref:Non-structural maintenance of chromosomes element 4 n=1 Tax=Octodon degus TaxID=10160 RepID=A0A6P3EUL3_OCTDE|nr:EP300-interacting inhibitor of differentiation 3 [Octodon degus]